MRGARAASWAEPRFGRFIPAHAGSTPDVFGSTRIVSVHPRACGEHYGPPELFAIDRIATVHPRACGEHLRKHGKGVRGFGSSPRMRGARPEIVDWPVHPRACGEHSRPQRIGKTQVPVHPRACGEHQKAFRWLSAGGSSPRMRGALLL